MVHSEGGADPETQVDSFFDRYEPPLAELGKAVRSKLRDRLPNFYEIVYLYGNQDALVISYSPTEHGYEALFSLRVDPRAVKLYFAQNSLPATSVAREPLNGRANAVRYIGLNSIAEFAGVEVQGLIAAALQAAKPRIDPSAKGSVIIKAASQGRRAERAKATKQRTSEPI